MRLSKSWIIARKDFKTFRRKRYVLITLIALPALISIMLPAVTTAIVSNTGAKTPAATSLLYLLPAFTFFWVIVAGILPVSIASYTLVGEKVEKTLEPMLAAPVTDSEILVGKSLSAILPSLASVLGGAVVFMVLMDLVTGNTLGYAYFPNINSALMLLVMAPLVTVLSVEWSVVVSSRVTDVRVAQQLGALVVLPLAGIYVAGEVQLIQLNVTENLLIIAGIIALIALLLFSFARETFQREEILTKWK